MPMLFFVLFMPSDMTTKIKSSYHVWRTQLIKIAIPPETTFAGNFVRRMQPIQYHISQVPCQTNTRCVSLSRSGSSGSFLVCVLLRPQGLLNINCSNPWSNPKSVFPVNATQHIISIALLHVKQQSQRALHVQWTAEKFNCPNMTNNVYATGEDCFLCTCNPTLAYT